jgi:hypothetical protein
MAGSWLWVSQGRHIYPQAAAAPRFSAGTTEPGKVQLSGGAERLEATISGALIGSPEPRLKRCTRATSIIGAISATLPSIRRASAVVPPLSKGITSTLPAATPKKAVARPPSAEAACQQPDR